MNTRINFDGSHLKNIISVNPPAFKTYQYLIMKIEDQAGEGMSVTVDINKDEAKQLIDDLTSAYNYHFKDTPRILLKEAL